MVIKQTTFAVSKETITLKNRNMKKNEKKMVNTLSNQEVRNLYGGCYPPSEEQLENIGPWGRYIVCW